MVLGGDTLAAREGQRSALFQIVTGAVGAVAAVVVVGVWNWASDGGLVRALGGLTDSDVRSIVVTECEACDGVEEQLKELETEIKEQSKQIEVLIRLIPSGAVLAFELEDCPEPEWKEYEKAYGRFIRGIDKKGSGIDPEGRRVLGSPQNHALAAHSHTRPNDVYDVGSFSDDSGVSYGRHFGFGFKNPPRTGIEGGEETRPVNVALLYCERV